MVPEQALAHHFQTNFTLMYHHKMDIRMFDEMIPWMRDVYVSMLVREVEEENTKLLLEQSAARAQKKRGNR